MISNDHLHNLDEGITEYFEFILKGFTYRFKYPNTEELEELRKAKENEGNDILFGFITKVDEKTPDFKELQKKMTVVHWKRFRQMISKEMGIDEDTPSKTNS